MTTDNHPPPRGVANKTVTGPAPDRADGADSGALLSLLARTPDLPTLFAGLHEHALQATGGRASAILARDPGHRGLSITSFRSRHRGVLADLDPGPEERLVLEHELSPGHIHHLGDLATRLPRTARLLRATRALVVGITGGATASGLLVGLGDEADAAAAARAIAPVADAFAVVLGRQQLEADAARREGLRSLVFDLAHAGGPVPELVPALERTCKKIVDHLSARHTEIWIFDRRARVLAKAAGAVARGFALPVEPAESLEAGEPVQTEAGRAEAAMRLKRLELSAGIDPDPEDPVMLTARVPLRGRRRAIGSLIVGGIPAPLPSPGWLEDAGRALSMAIEGAQLLDDVMRTRLEVEDVLDSITDLLVVADEQDHIVHVNEAFATRVGRRRERLAGRPLRELLGTPTIEWLASIDLPARVAGEPARPVHRQIADPALKGLFWMTATRLRGPDDLPAGRLLIARDAMGWAQVESDRIERRDRLTQAEKLAALGQFIAGIAHELNNPLQGVLGHLELLRAHAGINADVRRDLALIFREADRAARIVRNLLAFAGSRRIALRRVNLNTLASRVVALRAAACHAAGIEVVRTYDQHLPRITGDPLLLYQALLNVVINAEQELSANGGGQIEVATRQLPARQAVEIEVHDSGRGIPNEVLPRIFEPFFTTKEVGKGTGLGLAIAYGIVQEHGGEIAAKTHASGGTSFIITLPVRGALGATRAQTAP